MISENWRRAVTKPRLDFKLCALLLALFVFGFFQPTLAHGEDLRLRMFRDWGYAGFEHDIEGYFSLVADGPGALNRVDFYIGEDLVFSDEQSPFRVQFHTRDFQAGQQTIYALGFTASGGELRSNEFVRVFLSADEAKQKTVALIGPIFIFVAALFLISLLVQFLPRNKPEPGRYGISGGAVCPKCGLPISRHFFSFHAGWNKYERCPHCGKGAGCGEPSQKICAPRKNAGRQLHIN
jgi:hypothetical protein